MAYVSGKDLAYMLFDGVDVAISNNQLEIVDEAVIARRRPFGNSYPKAIPTGQYEGSMTLSGWLDTNTEPQLARLTGDEKIVSALVEGNTRGVGFWGLQNAYVAGRKLGITEDDIHSLDPTISVEGPVNYGLVVADYVERGAAGNTDAQYVDLGGAAAGGGVAYLHVGNLDLGGGTKCVVKLRDSADHTTFADKATFADITTVGAQTITVAGPLKRYLSISWAWTGGASQKITCFVGVAVD